ncbi:MAG: 3-deoxy-D-manno-octulosonic acid transferase [Rhodospirillales bacterium]|nr:3-deoxy-D-manno-octulosonic acid transferase [Rhodospirillales bacterium]
MSPLFARLLFACYRLLARAAGPVIRPLLARRARRGKEIPERLPERWGHSDRARPGGSLIWVHAASVGESLAVLPLVTRLHEEMPQATLLMTSTTVTSARLLSERLPRRIIHQFSPLDLPQAVGPFLDRWQPNLAIFVESELWPTQIWALDRRWIPRVLVNARTSSRSYRSWKRWPGLAETLLSGFSLVAAESARSAERLQALGASKVVTTGNLKDSAPPLPAAEAALEALRQALGTRPVWLAASTHPGEECLLFEAHLRIKRQLPDLLTLLVPRHPERGAEIAAAAEALGLTVALRSRGTEPDRQTEVYLADTLGELGLFYRLASIIFVGGSLAPVGGHNPLEPARLSAALLSGPHRDNVAEASQRLEAAGALTSVTDAESLADRVTHYLLHPEAAAAAATAALAVCTEQATALDRTWTALYGILEKAVKVSADGR